MKTTIVPSKDITNNQLKQIINLVNSADQIKIADLEDRLLRSELIAVIEDHNIVVCTATLKIPLISYVGKVFNKAKVLNNSGFTRELGYIVTHPDHEGKGYCNFLIKEFFRKIEADNIFATTRKPAMAHILIKNGFVKSGVIYDRDLQLLIYQR